MITNKSWFLWLSYTIYHLVSWNTISLVTLVGQIMTDAGNHSSHVDLSCLVLVQELPNAPVALRIDSLLSTDGLSSRYLQDGDLCVSLFTSEETNKLPDVRMVAAYN
jgi:hypothetical protein